MKLIAKERGTIDDKNTDNVPIDELVEITGDDEEVQEATKGKKYLHFIREGVTKMLVSGCRFPFVKKVTGSSAKLQMTAHMHISDALQGYWERNKKTYTHRAKSDYRMMYIGVISGLEEEQQLTGYDNSKEISKLQLFLEESEKRHKKYRDVSLLRSEVKILLAEQSAGDISLEIFDKEMERLTNAYAIIIGNRPKAISIISGLIQEEDTRAGNRIRQAKHRDYEQKSKGIGLVE